MKTITEMKFIYKLQPGEAWAVYDGNIIVVHPDREPKYIDRDGKEQKLEWNKVK